MGMNMGLGMGFSMGNSPGYPSDMAEPPYIDEDDGGIPGGA